MQDEKLKDYRSDLTNTLRFLNEAYDKMLLTLAGGALGLSIVFLKDILVVEALKSPLLLIWAWGLFIFSLAGVLGRLLFGIEAYRKALRQVDDGTIRQARPGGFYSIASRSLHISAALSLIAGFICIAAFAYKNVGEANAERKPQTTTAATMAASATSAQAWER
ncbi:hypothetical protein [Wenzhouxiangella sp. EGI_FJ10409]|uniref:hypothetical protein n=1 Tax=Wenzhouxiangella sp. EGI_FJ10409 TaxID=3243767 RepID=UPI0035D6D059